MVKEKIYSCSDECFTIIVKNSKSLKECLVQLNISGYTEPIRKCLKERIQELNIDISHFYNNQEWKKSRKYKYALKELLVENFEGTADGQMIINRIINAGLKEYKCEHCGIIGEYNGRPLTLQLHHKNGKHNDNRIENLEILCPNCHTQTDTYAGKNSKKINTIKPKKYCIKCGSEIKTNSEFCKKCYLENLKENNIRKLELEKKEDLQELIKTHSLNEIGRLYGVSCTTIKRWCTKLNIAVPSNTTRLDSDKIIEMYMNGMSIRKIARFLRTDDKKISKIVNKGSAIRSKEKRIIQLLDNGQKIEWPNISMAAKAIGKDKNISRLSECANGKRKTAYGYRWMWPNIT